MSDILDTPITVPAALSDWSDSYVEFLRDDTLMNMSDEEVLSVLLAEHEPMRFGRHIDLNIYLGFHFEPGNGIADLEEGCDIGRLVAVLDDVIDGITINRVGDMSWSSAGFEEHYIDRSDERLLWIFEKASGPRLLIAEHRYRKGDDFYFLVVRFLNKADRTAYDAAFPEAGA